MAIDAQVDRILEHVSDGILVVDRDWRLLHVNAQAARLLRRDVDELDGASLWEEFSEAVGTEFWEVYHRAVATQQPETFEAYYQPLQRWFEVRAFPAPEGLTAYFRDVTERHAAEQERRELVGQLTQSLRRSQRLFELSDALGQALTFEDVADQVTKHAHKALDCLFTGIAVIDREQSLIRFVSMAPLPDDVALTWTEFSLATPAPAADTARTGEPLVFADREELLRSYPHLAPDVEAAGTQAMANLPLISAGRTIGTLQSTWATPRTIDEPELQFLQTLAGQSAQAVERAKLFARQQSVAATLQQAILPRQLPAVADVALAARYETAHADVDVGGDWYDAYELPDGCLALTLGDVAGHGIDAAALMGQLRNAARAHAIDGLAPAAVATKLNHLLAHTPDSLLATFIFVVLDPRTGDLSWSNAGHPPPVLASPDGTARLLEQVHGPPLGAEETFVFGQSTDVIGDSALLLYSDGLIEDRRRSISDGLAALLAVAGDTLPTDLDDFCDTVAARVKPHTALEDDMCLLAARHTRT